MATTPVVRQLAGDFRFWEITETGRVPVNPDPDDPQGNRPLELDAKVFGYEAGEETNILSKRRDGRYNQILHNETLPGTPTVQLTALESPERIAALLFSGAITTADVQSGSVTEITHEVPAIDVPFQLPHRMLLASPAPVIEKVGTPSNTPLVAGTDYEIDLRRGQITFLAQVAPGDEIEVSYSYAAHKQYTIVGGTTPTRAFYLTGDVQDRISGEDMELRVPRVNLSVNGDVDLLAAEPMKPQFSGPIVLAPGESSPYTLSGYKATV